MVYALVLWFCAGQATGTIILGQVISIALLWGLGWQTLTVRREKTPVYQQTPVVITPEVVSSWAKNQLNQLRIAPDDSVRPLPPQNRSLSATAAERFRQDSDPRRRPVYDYEFVEDGELSESDEANDTDFPIEQPLIEPIVADLQFLEGREAPRDSEEEDLEEEDLEEVEVVPPSAEAEVISESIPDPVLEAVEAVEAIAVEPEPEPQKPAEPTPTESKPGKTEERIVKAKEQAVPEIPVEIEKPSTDPEGWGFESDEWIEEDSNDRYEQDSSQKERSSSVRDNPPEQDISKQSLPAKTKPSLLATPIILLGWVKDVVSSITKPKPSKPVIEIPRRTPQSSEPQSSEPQSSEPQSSADSAEPQTASKPLSTPPSPAPATQATYPDSSPDSSTAFDNSDNFDDPEDSNWDD